MIRTIILLFFVCSILLTEVSGKTVAIENEVIGKTQVTETKINGPEVTGTELTDTEALEGEHGKPEVTETEVTDTEAIQGEHVDGKKGLLARRYSEKFEAELQPNAKLEDFEIIRALGRGAFGVVEMVKHKKTKKVFAMKAIDINEESRWDMFELEIRANKGADSAFIVKMQYYFWDQPEEKPKSFLKRLSEKVWSSAPTKNGYLVLQLVSGGDFDAFIEKNQPLSENEIRFYAANMVMAVQYLHSRDMVHRDLKPANFLFGDNGYLMLADFGISRQLKKSCKSFTLCGTIVYMAPEMIEAAYDEDHTGYTQAVDWWSVGVILLELFTGKLPFDGNSQQEIFEKILSGRRRIPKTMSVEARSLLKQLLTRDPTKRLGYINNMKKHPFFKDLNWQNLNNQKIEAPYKPVFDEDNKLTGYQKNDQTGKSVPNKKGRNKEMKTIYKSANNHFIDYGKFKNAKDFFE